MVVTSLLDAESRMEGGEKGLDSNRPDFWWASDVSRGSLVDGFRQTVGRTQQATGGEEGEGEERNTVQEELKKVDRVTSAEKVVERNGSHTRKQAR